jgi:hypothetical protein
VRKHTIRIDFAPNGLDGMHESAKGKVSIDSAFFSCPS